MEEISQVSNGEAGKDHGQGGQVGQAQNQAMRMLQVETLAVKFVDTATSSEMRSLRAEVRVLIVRACVYTC